MVNPYIGKSIQTAMTHHPNETHIITCGDAHILHNDLSNHVNIGAAAGVVDPSSI